jgi:hypothetical protein
MLPMAHCGLLENERMVEVRKAAGLGPDDGAQSGRLSFEVVKGLIRSQIKDGPPSHVRTSGFTVMALSGTFRALREGRKSCLPN